MMGIDTCSRTSTLRNRRGLLEWWLVHGGGAATGVGEEATFGPDT